MALHFDYSKVKTLPNGDDPKQQPRDEFKWHPVGDAIVWATLVIGVSEITAKNYQQVFERLSLYQRITGPLLEYADDVKVYVTLEDVQAFIGLSTNAGRMTDAEWLKHAASLGRDNPVTNTRLEGGEYVSEPAFVLVRRQIDKYAEDIDAAVAVKRAEKAARQANAAKAAKVK